MSTAEPTTYTAEPPAGRNPRTIALIVVAVLVAAVIGGGAFAVARMLGGGGDRPAAAMPAGTTAYVQVDIDPSAGQKLAAMDFLSELEPEIMDGAQDGDLKRELFEAMAQDNDELSALSYEEDVEPWLGDRAGMGLVSMGPEAEPVPLVAIQASDTDAAEAALEQIEDDAFGWYVQGDYIVALPAEHRDTVLADVEAGTLAASDTFTGDLDELGDQGIVSGWVDVAAVQQMTTSQLAAEGMDEAMGELGLGDLGMESQLAELSQGRFAFAVRFADDAIELAAVTRGSELAGPSDSDTASLVNELPADTFAAFGVEHGDEWVDLVWEQLTQIAPEEMASAEQEAAAQGFDLPADLKVLLGDSLTLSADASVVDLAMGVEEPTEIPVAYRVSTDTARVQELLDLSFQSSGMSPEETGVITRSDDGVFTIGGGQGYVDSLVEGGDTLGDDDLYNRTVADAEDADVVLYVNLDSVEDSYLSEIPEEDRSAVELLSAFGFSSTMAENGDTDMVLRLVTD